MIVAEWPRLAGAATLLVAYAGLCMHAWRAAQTRRAAQASEADAHAQTTLIVHASQTGFARELADEVTRWFAANGRPHLALPLERVDAGLLRRCRQAFFILSTSGEGDAPDHASGFERRAMGKALALPGLEYAVLALGDRSYRQFCAFGRRVDAWLAGNGARRLMPRVELDGTHAATLERWRTSLRDLLALPAAHEPESPTHGHWRIVRRVHLNPGSAGAPVVQVELAAVGGERAGTPVRELPHWEAGDLLELAPPGDDAPRARSYSIASLPTDGRIQLLVRLARDAQGRHGRLSSLLTDLGAGATLLRGRIRPHPGFRAGDNARRPLILIGNGTGLGGLLAHIRQRAARGEGRNWLLFGERNAAHDSLHAAELQALQQQGLIARLDRVFSRDTPRAYVQDRLRGETDRLKQWIADDSAIYVCGAAASMGTAVHAVLAEALGTEALARLSEEGRYRRDLY